MGIIERYKKRRFWLEKLMEYESADSETLYEFVIKNKDNFEACSIHFDAPIGSNRQAVLNVFNPDMWEKIAVLINRYKEYKSQILLDERLEQASKLVIRYNKQRPILTVREFCDRFSVNYNCFIENLSLLEKYAPVSVVIIKYYEIQLVVSNTVVVMLKRLLGRSHLIRYDGVVEVVEECGLSFDTFSDIISDVKTLESCFSPIQIKRILEIYNSYLYVKQPKIETERKKLYDAIKIFDKVLSVLDTRYLSEACSTVVCDNGEKLTVMNFEKNVLPLIKEKDSNRYSMYKSLLVTGEDFRNQEIISGLKNFLAISDNLLSYTDEELFNYVTSMYPDSYRIPFINARSNKLMGEFAPEEQEILNELKKRYCVYKNNLIRRKKQKN